MGFNSGFKGLNSREFWKEELERRERHRTSGKTVSILTLQTEVGGFHNRCESNKAI